MKRILLFLSAVFIATTAIAHTINWYVDGSVYHTTTCESGENVTPPTAPEKYGYTFRGWEGYTQIEYLQGSSTAYINTLYKVNPNIGVKTKIQFETVANSKGFVFGGGHTYNFELFSWDDKLCFCSGGKYTCGTPINDNDILELNWNKNTVSYTINYSDNNLLNLTDSPGNGTYLHLYTLSRSLSPSKIKIYYFQIYDNSVLVRDFIPVLDKDGVPCMYDKVEHKFYYNSGTGDFIAGPIIGE